MTFPSAHLILLKQRRPLHRRAMQPLTDAAIAEPGKSCDFPYEKW
jgi:hypothetical protein